MSVKHGERYDVFLGIASIPRYPNLLFSTALTVEIQFLDSVERKLGLVFVEKILSLLTHKGALSNCVV
jgi:hypothetical protein